MFHRTRKITSAGQRRRNLNKKKKLGRPERQARNGGRWMKGGASANPGKHEPVKSLSQLHLFVTTTFARKKKSYFREFQPEKQLSFFSPLSSFSSLLPPAGLSSHGTLDREQLPGLSKIHRERVSCVSQAGKGAGNSRKIVVPSRSRRNSSFEFRSKADARCFTSFPSWKPPVEDSAFFLSLSLSGQVVTEKSLERDSRFDRPSTKQHCSNINTGNRRGDSQTLPGFVIPVAESLHVYPEVICARVCRHLARVRVTYSSHPRVYRPTGDLGIRYNVGLRVSIFRDAMTISGTSWLSRFWNCNFLFKLRNLHLNIWNFSFFFLFFFAISVLRNRRV